MEKINEFIKQEYGKKFYKLSDMEQIAIIESVSKNYLSAIEFLKSKNNQP